MKILFCTNTLGGFGGIERVTIVKANALAAIEGNEVYICFTDKGAFPKTIHPLSPKIKVFDLETPYWGFNSTLKLLLGFIPLIRKTRKRLLDVIKTVNPDVIISTGSYEKYAAASIGITGIKRQSAKQFAMGGGNTLLIREYHFNSNFRRYMNHSKYSLPAIKVAEWVESRILSCCFDKSFLLTESDLNTNFKNRLRFDYMHNPTSFCPETVSEYSDRPKTILAVGRISAQKNFEAMIKIWNKICRQAPGWKLRIVGDGSGMDSLQRLVKDLGISDFTELIGRSFNVDKELDSAQVFVLTSKYEGFAVVLVEAMTFGLPIVSFDTPYGPSEIVRNNVDGFIVGYNDKEAFANKLLMLIRDETLRQRMSDNALTRSKDFTPDAIAEKWMETYSRLLAEKNTRKRYLQ